MDKSERVRRRKGDGSSRTDDGVSEARTANGTGCGERWANTSKWGAKAKDMSVGMKEIWVYG